MKKLQEHEFSINLALKVPQMKNFVTMIEVKLADKIKQDLIGQNFEITIPPYTLFSAKKKGVSCTLYQSGKLMVQGKEMDQFIEFYLEPEILKTFSHSYADLDLNLAPRIGIDESGKGDFFGPLCVAGVFAGDEQIKDLRALGVQDSKKINDQNIIKIGSSIKREFLHHIVKINPAKYNELHGQFGNLNLLLAWGHATTIEHLIEKSHCQDVIIDQFANEYVVLNALKKKKLILNLTQRHKAEEDLVVAAASILARQTFLEGLILLEEKYKMKFPKGASQSTIQAGKEFVRKYGISELKEVGKMHFKTIDSILGGL